MLLVEQFARAALEVADHAYVMERGPDRGGGDARGAPPRRAGAGGLPGLGFTFT